MVIQDTVSVVLVSFLFNIFCVPAVEVSLAQRILLLSFSNQSVTSHSLAAIILTKKQKTPIKWS
jgi:hypothetical protein